MNECYKKYFKNITFYEQFVHFIRKISLYLWCDSVDDAGIKYFNLKCNFSQILYKNILDKFHTKKGFSLIWGFDKITF